MAGVGINGVENVVDVAAELFGSLFGRKLCWEDGRMVGQ
jgi:hypothetical protein